MSKKSKSEQEKVKERDIDRANRVMSEKDEADSTYDTSEYGD